MLRNNKIKGNSKVLIKTLKIAIFFSFSFNSKCFNVAVYYYFNSLY
jgi:hypothetical protein